MGTVCLKCGDRGFPETLAFCTKCQAYAMHRYCLDGPVIFTDKVTWFCEDCEARVVVLPSLDQSKPLSSETSDSVNLENNAIQARREVKSCIRRVKKNNKKREKKIEEKKGKVNSGLVAEKKCLLSDSRSSPELEHPKHSISCGKESELKNKCGPALRDIVNSEGSKFVPVSQVAPNDDLSCAEFESHVDAQPIVDPIWRGSLFICNETIGTVSGLLAHLSSLSCPKVLEETILFPEVLQAELLPRSKVWPKSFKNGEPTDHSIALYFFPESERAEKVFDMLINEIICLESAIRFEAKSAELLIFPSTALPVQNWRFQAKYYLWGVFKRKQASRHK